MDMKTLEPDVLNRVFRTLSPKDQAEILRIGVAFHRLSLEKRLARARNKVQAFETRYCITLDRLQADGLPDDADYAVHEDYVEWCYWSRVSKQTRRTLDSLAVIGPATEPT